MSKKVAILGGGVAGMSAAHELVERGFTVEVYEFRKIPGGKARSLPVPGSGVAGRKDLPGEHGFRFFPGFYKHLPHTMQRIPYKQGRNVLDNLATASRALTARARQTDTLQPTHFPESLDDLATAFEFLFNLNLTIPPEETLYFVTRLLVLLTSCEERRFKEYEEASWWNFVGADTRSDNYKKFVAEATRSLVAARAREISARTGGCIALQLLFDLAEPGQHTDRILNGPTNEVWIQPWLDHLQNRDVVYHTGAEVREIQCVGQRVTAVTIVENNGASQIAADYYIAALPVEVMQRLVTDPMKTAEPRLAELHRLRTAWMNGIQFYLAHDVPIVHGHTLYLDSPWALTSISQKQFWPDFDLADYGNGMVGGILSVDISDWNTPGILHNKPATECRPEEIQEEVWEQLKQHLNDDAVHEIEDTNLVAWFLDPAIVYSNNPTRAENQEPLLINTVGSWNYRPEAVTGIENFFLASDYVRTYTDLATMEAANEAARRAVNGVLQAEGRPPSDNCQLWPLQEPEILKPLRAFDHELFKLGLSHPLEVLTKENLPLRYLFKTGLSLFLRWKAPHLPGLSLFDPILNALGILSRLK